MSVIITGTGSYIPSSVTSNDEFKDHRFFNEDGEQLSENNEVIIRKFKAIPEFPNDATSKPIKSPQTLQLLPRKEP